MSAVKPENLNAIKFHLVLLNVATKAAQFNLAEEIKSRATPSTASALPPTPDPNCVSKFLKEFYDDIIRQYFIYRQYSSNIRNIPDYLKNMYRTLLKFNQASSFPNDLDSFDISACCQIARKIRSPIKKVFIDLTEMRNDYYGHLKSLTISDANYGKQLKNLESYINKFCPDTQYPQEHKENTEQIEKIKKITEVGSYETLKNYTQCLQKFCDDKKLTLIAIESLDLTKLDEIEKEFSAYLNDNQIDLKQFFNEITLLKEKVSQHDIQIKSTIQKK